MTLNCKKDNLAIVVNQEGPGSIPRDSIVRCLPLESVSHWLDGPNVGKVVTNVWHVEWRGATYGSVGRFGVRDCNLRPLKNPGDDESDSRDIKLGEAMRGQVREGAEA